MIRVRKLLPFLLAITIGVVQPLFEVAPSAAQEAESPISTTAWSPDSTRYATGDYDGYVQIWDAATGQLVEAFPAPDFNLSGPPLITSISWSSDGVLLAIAASASTQPSAYVWTLDLTTGQTTMFEGASLIYAAALNPDGTLLAVGVEVWEGYRIRVWDVASQQLIAELEDFSDIILSVAWSPDGTRLASCSADAASAIWDTATWTRLMTLGEFPTHPTLWGAWSPDGTKLATTSIQGTALIWDTTTGQLVMTLTSHDDKSLYEIVWSPDGGMLAGVSAHSLKIWDAATGAQIGTLETEEYLDTLDWSPDGAHILYGGVGFREPQLVEPSTLIEPVATPTPAPTETPTVTPTATRKRTASIGDRLAIHRDIHRAGVAAGAAGDVEA